MNGGRINGELTKDMGVRKSQIRSYEKGASLNKKSLWVKSSFANIHYDSEQTILEQFS